MGAKKYLYHINPSQGQDDKKTIIKNWIYRQNFTKYHLFL
jgi:hypothetical protein